jgi:excisionase family DNA binding protein
MTPRLLGVRDAAVYLGVTEHFVRSLVWDRKLPKLLLGKRLLFDRHDLDNFVEGLKKSLE